LHELVDLWVGGVWVKTCIKTWISRSLGGRSLGENLY